MQRQEQSLSARRSVTVRIPIWVLPFAGGRFSSKDLATFYHQFGEMIQAGVPIQRALHTLRRAAPRAMRRVATQISILVNEGEPFHEAIERSSGRFPQLDRYLLGVSEQSGALDTGLLSLAAYYDERARARGQFLSALILPMIVLIAAVFISRFPALVLGTFGSVPYTTADYLRDTVGFLAVLVAVVFGAYWMGRWLLSLPGANLIFDRFLRMIPIFGAFRLDYALSQWFESIRLLLNAGHGIVHAMEHASRMVPSPLLARAYSEARALVDEGSQVSEALRATGFFPEQVLQFWATGEESGRMDEMLERLSEQYRERWRRSLSLLASWLPWLAYVLVGIYIIYQMFVLLGPIVGTYRDLLR